MTRLNLKQLERDYGGDPTDFRTYNTAVASAVASIAQRCFRALGNSSGAPRSGGELQFASMGGDNPNYLTLGDGNGTRTTVDIDCVGMGNHQDENWSTIPKSELMWHSRLPICSQLRRPRHTIPDDEAARMAVTDGEGDFEVAEEESLEAIT
jgi:hypothetical protein